MSIVILCAADGILEPRICCDVCQKVHDRADEGVHAVYDCDLTLGQTAQVMHVCAGLCDARADQYIKQRNGLPGWEYISPHLLQLLYNMAMIDRVTVRHIEGRNTQPSLTGNVLRDRFSILKRDGYRCQLCGRSAQDGAVLEIDHRHPRSKGGLDSPENLWTLCFECNRGKGARDL